MKKEQFFSRTSLRFKRFSRKGYALFSVLGREVLIGVLSVAVVSHAMAEGVSVVEELAKDTVVREAQTLDDVVVLGSRAPLTEGETAKIVTVITSDDIHRAAVATVNDALKMGCPSARWLRSTDGYLHRWRYFRPDCHSA